MNVFMVIVVCVLQDALANSFHVPWFCLYGSARTIDVCVNENSLAEDGVYFCLSMYLCSSHADHESH